MNLVQKKPTEKISPHKAAREMAEKGTMDLPDVNLYSNIYNVFYT